MRRSHFAVIALRSQLALRTVALRATAASRQQPPGRFRLETMRVDYFHSGGPGGEAITLDRVLNDGPWPGSRTQLIDTTDLGKYFFEVVDRASNRPIYSRGFASIYGEWETTPEVRSANRTFHESLRFPWPTARFVWSSESVTAEYLPRALDHRDRSQLRDREPDGPAPPWPGVTGVRERCAWLEGRHPSYQRGLHGSAVTEISRRCQATRRCGCLPSSRSGAGAPRSTCECWKFRAGQRLWSSTCSVSRDMR